MYPYRPADVFRVNPDARVEQRTLPDDAGRYLVVDDFYADPDAVRRLILTTPYTIWAHHETSRNFVDYYDCRQNIQVPFLEPQQALAAMSTQGLTIDVTQGRHHFVTNVFKLINDQPPDSQPFPHDDGINVAGIVMLNTPEECSGGTAFYRCKDPDITCMPLERERYDALRQRIYSGPRGHKGSAYFLEQWQRWWERVEMVEMRYNRMLVYPGILFHGHWQEHNAFKDVWRVNQLMFFDEVEFHPYYKGISKEWTPG